jgi:dUTP pyrophosphatase
VKLKYQLLSDDKGNRGIMPTKGTEESVCYDLFLPVDVDLSSGRVRTVPLLIAFDIPQGFYIEVFPRSSLQTNHGVISSTSIIDTDYKKGIHAILNNANKGDCWLKKGMKVMQFMLKKKEDCQLIEVEQIDDTGRGGLGSTGS